MKKNTFEKKKFIFISFLVLPVLFFVGYFISIFISEFIGISLTKSGKLLISIIFFPLYILCVSNVYFKMKKK